MIRFSFREITIPFHSTCTGYLYSVVWYASIAMSRNEYSIGKYSLVEKVVFNIEPSRYQRDEEPKMFYLTDDQKSSTSFPFKTNLSTNFALLVKTWRTPGILQKFILFVKFCLSGHKKILRLVWS